MRPPPPSGSCRSRPRLRAGSASPRPHTHWRPCRGGGRAPLRERPRARERSLPERMHAVAVAQLNTACRGAKYGISADLQPPWAGVGSPCHQRSGGLVDLYVILRRNGWRTGQDLEEAAARSTTEGDKDGSGVRWIRSYVLAEESGEVGTVCIYEAESPEAIRAHADAADLPVDEIIRVADTVVVRPDPVAAAT